MAKSDFARKRLFAIQSHTLEILRNDSQSPFPRNSFVSFETCRIMSRPIPLPVVPPSYAKKNLYVFIQTFFFQTWCWIVLRIHPFNLLYVPRQTKHHFVGNFQTSLELVDGFLFWSHPSIRRASKRHLPPPADKFSNVQVKHLTLLHRKAKVWYGMVHMWLTYTGKNGETDLFNIKEVPGSCSNVLEDPISLEGFRQIAAQNNITPFPSTISHHNAASSVS